VFQIIYRQHKLKLKLLAKATKKVRHIVPKECEIHLRDCRSRIKNYLILQSSVCNLKREGVFQQVFKIGASTSGKLSGKSFSKLLRETTIGVVGKVISAADIDIIFMKTTTKLKRYLTFPQFMKILFDIIKKVHLKRDKLIEQRECDIYMLKFYFDHILPSKKGRMIDRLCEKSVTEYLNLNVLQIQCAFRQSLAYHYMRKVRESSKVKAQERKMIDSLIRIQGFVRGSKARSDVANKATRFYRKYVDTVERCYYWHNPFLDTILWSKPALLRKLDCEGIIKLEKYGEYLVSCVCCPKKADITCVTCIESFCSECFSLTHCNRKKVAHNTFRIASCSFCGAQHATKQCMTCSSEALSPCLFCDICFAREHYTDALKKHLVSRCVKECDHCFKNAVQWYCEDCDDFYCRPCFLKDHNRGNRSTHNLKRIPYFSSSVSCQYFLRKKRIKYIELTKRYQDTILRENNVLSPSLIIQKTWRGFSCRRKVDSWRKEYQQTRNRHNCKPERFKHLKKVINGYRYIWKKTKEILFT